ncbi:MAG: NrsF family protein [Sphingomonadaceae bacterium]
MNTEDLIEQLANAAPPPTRSTAFARLALWIATGALVTLVLVALLLGLRPDLDVAMAGGLFWMKLSYTGSLAFMALAGLAVLGRPEARPPRWLWAMLLPVGALAVVTIVEAAAMDRNAWMALWLGETWQACSVLVFALAIPIGLALIRPLRAFAPTRLRLTGALAGMAAGSLAAMIYCLHCPEAGAAFVLTWYSLGIATVAALGALLGPRLLRW